MDADHGIGRLYRTYRERVERNIGGLCTLDGRGDIAINGEIRKHIGEGAIPLRIVKITKAGKVLVCEKDNPGRQYVVPVRNIVPIEVK